MLINVYAILFLKVTSVKIIYFQIFSSQVSKDEKNILR